MGGKVSLIIPCYNEEKGIAEVINNIPYKHLESLNYDIEIIVVDNNCTDKTAKIAKDLGVKVIKEKRQGKGHALMAGFDNIARDSKIIIMIDGDNTYKSSEMLRLIEPVDSGFCKVALGTRLGGKIGNESMTYFNRVGNWMLTFLVRIGYKGNVTDVCTGYFCWSREVIDKLKPHLRSDGFSIEMEMITKMAKMRYEIFSFPISYEEREGSSNLNPVADGAKIFMTWAKYLFWTDSPKYSFFKRDSTTKA